MTTPDYKRFEMTEADYLQARNMYLGRCIQCGEFCESIEPDCAWERCESCGGATVFGLEELLIRGRVCIVAAEQEN